MENLKLKNGRINKLSSERIINLLRKNGVELSERSKFLDILIKRGKDVSEFIEKKEKFVSGDRGEKSMRIREVIKSGEIEIRKILRIMKKEGWKIYYSEVERIINKEVK